MSKGIALTACMLTLIGCSENYSNSLENDHGLSTAAQKSLFCSEAFLISANKHEELARKANSKLPRVSLEHKLISKDFYFIFQNTAQAEQQAARSITKKSHLISYKHPLVEIKELTAKCVSYAQSIGYSPKSDFKSRYMNITLF